MLEWPHSFPPFVFDVVGLTNCGWQTSDRWKLSRPGQCLKRSSGPATAGMTGLSAPVLIDLRERKVSTRKPRAVRPLLVDDLPERVEAVSRDAVKAQRA